MAPTKTADIEIPSALLGLVQSFPATREIPHCNTVFHASSLAIYAKCPQCGKQIKLRSFGASAEFEDLMDAFLSWMNRPENAEIARKRMAEIAADSDED